MLFKITIFYLPRFMEIKQQRNSILQAVKVLQQGGVVVYPTETAYGLGADATNARAVEHIFELKGRIHKKTVLVLMRDIEMVKEYAHINTEELKLMRAFWPGALTLVLRAKKQAYVRLARGVVARDGAIAVRVSSNAVAAGLVKHLGRPLVSTSANRAGGSNTYSVQSVQKQLGARLRGASFPYYIYDAGRLPRCKPSTVARVYKEKIKILRQGDVFL